MKTPYNARSAVLINKIVDKLENEYQTTATDGLIDRTLTYWDIGFEIGQAVERALRDRYLIIGDEDPIN